MFSSITIGINPNLIDSGSFVLSWHGLLTFVAVALAVVLVARWGRREGIIADTVYSVAVWAVLGGIVGARLVHVIDRWDFYGDNLSQVYAVWQGGIAIYGAIIGGFLGGATYVWINHHFGRLKALSVGHLADITAPAILIAQAVGRIGDIINGEHIAKITDLPWGYIYSHPLSPSNERYGLTASHPAVAYELLWDLAVLAVIWRLRGRLRPHGMLFAVYGMLYALGRFFIQFLRLDKEWFAGLQEAHVLSIIVLAVTVSLLASRARWVRREDMATPTPTPTRRRTRTGTDVTPPAPRRRRTKTGT